jgi:hypothetical protein
VRQPPYIPDDPPWRPSAADIAGIAAFMVLLFVLLWWLRDWLELLIRFGTWVRGFYE